MHDILVEPADDAELVTRVQAAGRTKALQEEIVAQAQRLEALLFEDPLTGLVHFKAVNDASGHTEGDRILAAVAQELRRHLRAEDQLGRLGGEEFLALLPDTEAAAAPAAAEK